MSSNEGPLARSEEQQLEDLVQQVQKTEILMEHVKEQDRKLGLSKEYIQNAKRVKSKKGENGDEAMNWMAAHTEFDNDEDMMADL